MQGQPRQFVRRRDPQPMAMTDNQTAFLGLANGGSDVVLRNAEGDEVPIRRFQVAVSATAAPHVLDHQETHDSESVDPKGAECVAFQNLAGDLDKLFLAAHAWSPRASMRPAA
jgi:hypothetical protein